jgi:hypothetical protein
VLNQLGAVEGFGHVPVRPHGHRFRRIDRGGTTQEQHRNVLQRGIRPDALAELVSAQPGHADVGENQVRFQLLRRLERGLPVIHDHHAQVLARERHSDRLLDGLGIVGEEKVLGHARGLHRG